LARGLARVRVEPVLTAHPTAAKRATVLEHYRGVYQLLAQCKNRMWIPLEQYAIRCQLKTTLERLWRTGEIFLENPDMPSERRNVIHYLRQVFPRVLPRLDLRLRQALAEVYEGAALVEGVDRLLRHGRTLYGCFGYRGLALAKCRDLLTHCARLVGSFSLSITVRATRSSS